MHILLITPETFYKPTKSKPTPSRVVLYMHTIVPMTVVEACYFVWAQGGIVVEASCDINGHVTPSCPSEHT